MDRKSVTLYASTHKIGGPELGRWMEENGVKYQRWEAHPIADQIHVFGCQNVPDKLPDGVSAKE